MTPTAGPPLPQLDGELWLTDGGLETTLLFGHGIDLVDFAAFPLLGSADGREALRRYYEPYLDLAEGLGTGFVLDTPTWRASPGWAVRQGHDEAAVASVNERAVRFVVDLAAGRDLRTVVNGVVGPRGDGYVVGAALSPDEAADHHGVQARAFAAAGADMVTAVTMTYVEEAVGVVRAAVQAGLPVVVSFTVETDGVLPSGTGLAEAVTAVDAATDGAAAYFMVNCAHPAHFADVLAAGGDWTERVRGVRANASTMSHAELDAATELDRGDPDDLAARYVGLREALPRLAVVGGCCGTDHEHVAAMAARLA